MPRPDGRMATRWNPNQIPQIVSVLENSIKERVDQVSADLVYYGQAYRDTGEDQAGWFISRVTKSGTTTSIDLASNGFDQIWNSRASLTYA